MPTSFTVIVIAVSEERWQMFRQALPYMPSNNVQHPPISMANRRLNSSRISNLMSVYKEAICRPCNRVGAGAKLT